MSKRSAAIHATLPLLLAALAAGCSSQDIGNFGLGGHAKGGINGPAAAPPPANAAATKQPVAAAGTGGAVTIDRTQQSKVTEAVDSANFMLQVKDVALLRSSVEACMGDGMLAVSADMLLPSDVNAAPVPLTGGKIAFLMPTEFKTGDDIMEKEKKNLVDLEGGVRTTIVADALTDTYLRALESIGNVVAHNCKDTNPNCRCGSKDDAMAMLNRCLPQLDPASKTMEDTAGLLGTICGSGPAGMRRAISSMLSSYAFAAAR